MCSGLEELRQEIDLIDDKIKALFDRRMALVLDIGKIKAKGNLPVLDSEREREIVSRLTADQEDNMVAATKILFTALFEASRSYQLKKLG